MDIQTTSVFWNNYDSKKKININRGGTRSGKTYNLVQLFLYWLLYGKIDDDKYFDKGILTIVRRYGSNLKTSTMRDLENIIDIWGVRKKITINKTDRTYTYGERVIEFMGADDQQKLRGTTRDILYCNEANELGYKSEFFQLLIRTKYKVFIDFNPDDEDIWINTELEQKRRLEKKDVRVIISTYLDNPFLGEAQVQEIEYLEKEDPMLWEIYGKGNYGKIQGVIFERYKNWDIIKSIPKEAEYIGSGMDFGFTNDPTTLNDLYRYNGEILIDQIIYNTGMTNQDIGNKIKSIESQTFKRDIIGDSAEPKSIEELKRMGIRIIGAVKGPDSIKYGIGLMKDYKLQITETSIETIKEFKKYIWKVKKSGDLGNVPIDNFNHSIDGIRYLVMGKLGNKRSPSIFIG